MHLPAMVCIHFLSQKERGQPSRPTKKMLIVPFVNPFSQREESIGREEGERAQLAAAAGGEGEGVRRLAGQVVPTPRAHCISSGEERRRKRGGGGDGQLERRRGRKAKLSPLISSFSLLGFSGGNTIHAWLDCENGDMHFGATSRHRDVVTRQFPSPSRRRRRL